MIPFEVTIPDEERDEQLADKLKEELPGILNWALKGLAMFREHGMMYPDKVNAATAAYRESQDVIGQFIKARCLVAEYASARTSELYDAYKSWAADKKEYVLKERQFKEAVKKHGFTPQHKNDGNYYCGIASLSYSARQLCGMDDFD
jgi:putative DNA primase/helicase